MEEGGVVGRGGEVGSGVGVAARLADDDDRLNGEEGWWWWWKGLERGGGF